ncbi:class I SAM-dependent methyltransferase [Bradyrhizobium sp. HKCCYLS3077]|uniref:class I SAM-dependent methyltransferase n=1 Tax=Bradyrhizobium sp. HKCCYLS3077 TaxID=3420761 RepID=UPI003EBA0E9A
MTSDTRSFSPINMRPLTPLFISIQREWTELAATLILRSMKTSPSTPELERSPAPGSAFTPAFPVLGAYDLIVRWVSRETAWRSALIDRLDARDSELIVDAGCGTGSLLMLLGVKASGARLIGIDPDARILDRAAAKLARASVQADLKHGFLRDVCAVIGEGQASKITSSLVFHQVPMQEKRAGLAAMVKALAPGGTVLIADYGLQRTMLMRSLFKLVQCVDGFVDTQPNADGLLPQLMREAGFTEVVETDLFATPSGSISIYRGRAPQRAG